VKACMDTGLFLCRSKTLDF